MENLHTIDFVVPLSGSKLFDMMAYGTAQKLCAKFPGLEFKYEHDKIRVSGQLNDDWYAKWNKMVFEAGRLEG